jgi:uncharacterized membrane protein
MSESTIQQSKFNINPTVKFITMSALFTALVFVATYAVQIPLPGLATGGLIHLGNVALFTISIIFGKKYGAISGAFGMALFDVLSPWVIWAPGTFIIRGVMGYMVGYIANKNREGKISVLRLTAAMVIPSIWMIAGYFGYNLLLFGNYPAAIASIPGDLIQIGAGIAISLPIMTALHQTGADKTLKKLSSV